jgi:hypothetical protein
MKAFMHRLQPRPPLLIQLRIWAVFLHAEIKAVAMLGALLAASTAMGADLLAISD